MSIRSNGSYIGPRPTGPSTIAASGIWDLRTAERQRRASAWPNTDDPFFSNVSLLLHMDGTGSTFLDSSGSPKTITANGDATQSTAQSKFGGKSAFFDGSGDSVSFADIQLGIGNFTIELWFRTDSSTQYAQLIGNESGLTTGFTVLINNNSSTGGQIAVFRAGVLAVQSSSGDWSDGAWHFLALVRSGATVALYIDGTLYGSGNDSGSYDGGNYYLGTNNFYPGRDLAGYIDELRITKGIARYTANFTPPTAAFPDS